MKFQPLFVAVIALLATVLPGGAEIIIRVSVKYFTDAAGNPPLVDLTRGPTAEFDTPQAIAQWLVDGGNDSPDLLQRGYRFELSEDIVMLPSSLAAWFMVDPRTGPAKGNLEAAALANPPLFGYRANAVNIYINNFATSGSCSRPANGTTTFLGRNIYRALVAHEVGHFFDLCHTQGCECDGTTDADPLKLICLTQPGNDNLDDTLLDLDTWTMDQVTFMQFGFNYSAPEVSDAQRRQVDYTFQNLMSYHLPDPLPDGTANPYNLLTEDQLDRYGNTANNQRRAQVSGTSWFVAASGADAPGRGLSSATPLRTVAAALGFVNSADDVVLLRSATYSAPPGVIAIPCTLRAARGPVTLTR